MDAKQARGPVQRRDTRRRGKGTEYVNECPTYETWGHPLGQVDSRPLRVVAVAARDADSKGID